MCRATLSTCAAPGLLDCSQLFAPMPRDQQSIYKVNTFIRIHCMDIHFKLNGESLVWNAVKAQKNLRKHGRAV